MLKVSTAIAEALQDDAAVVGWFLSLGLVQSDGVVVWQRFSNQVMLVELAGEEYDQTDRIVQVILPARRTLNRSGGRGGQVRIIDARHQVFDNFRSLSSDSTRLQVALSFFHLGVWTAPLYVFTGVVGDIEYDEAHQVSTVGMLTRIGNAGSNAIFVDDFDQRRRDLGDTALDQVGRQTYLPWEG